MHPEFEILTCFHTTQRRMWGWEDVTHAVGVDISSYLSPDLEQYGTSFKSSLRASEWSPGKALCSPSNPQWSQDYRKQGPPLILNVCANADGFLTSREEWVQGQGESSPLLLHLGTDRRNRWQRASRVARWMGVRLPMQGTLVQPLAWEDSACSETAGPLRHNYWVRTLEPRSRTAEFADRELVLCKRSHRKEKPAHRNEETSPLAATRESPRAATKTQCRLK